MTHDMRHDSLEDMLWEINQHDTDDSMMLAYAVGLDHTVWSLTYRTAPGSSIHTIQATATISLPTSDTIMWTITPGRSVITMNGMRHTRDTTHKHTDTIIKWLTHEARQTAAHMEGEQH